MPLKNNTPDRPQTDKIFLVEIYEDEYGRTIKRRNADGELNFIGQQVVTLHAQHQQIPVQHAFEIEATTIEEAFALYDETLEATFKERMRQEQENQSRILRPGASQG